VRFDHDLPCAPRLAHGLSREIDDALGVQAQLFAQNALGKHTREREELIELALGCLVFVDPERNGPRGERRDRIGATLCLGLEPCLGRFALGLAQDGLGFSFCSNQEFARAGGGFDLDRRNPPRNLCSVRSTR